MVRSDASGSPYLEWKGKVTDFGSCREVTEAFVPGRGADRKPRERCDRDRPKRYAVKSMEGCTVGTRTVGSVGRGLGRRERTTDTKPSPDLRSERDTSGS